MKNIIIKIAMTALLCTSQSANAQNAEGQKGEGGALVEKNGRLMTFYTAGLYVEPKAKTEVDFPDLRELVNYIAQMPFIASYDKGQMMMALATSANRNYYFVKKERFTSEIRKRIIAEYMRVTNIPEDAIQLAAITDTRGKNTLIFPEYWALQSKAERFAILFHEAYRVAFPTANYQAVIDAEMAFQAVIEQPSNLARYAKLADYWGGIRLKFPIMLLSDAQSGALKGLLDRNYKLNLFDLFGEAYLKCAVHQSVNNCKHFIIPHVLEIKSKYPHSLLIADFYEAVLDAIETPRGGSYEVTFKRRCENGLTYKLLGSFAWSGIRSQPVDVLQFSGQGDSYKPFNAGIFGGKVDTLVIRLLNKKCTIDLNSYQPQLGNAWPTLKVDCGRGYQNFSFTFYEQYVPELHKGCYNTKDRYY